MLSEITKKSTFGLFGHVEDVTEKRMIIIQCKVGQNVVKSKRR